MYSLMCPTLKPSDVIEITFDNGHRINITIPDTAVEGRVEIKSAQFVLRYILLKRDGQPQFKAFYNEAPLPPPEPEIDDSEEVDFNG